MNKTASWSLAAVITLGLFVLAGCGNSASKREGPATYPVTGIVTHNGKPVSGASVRFLLNDGSRRPRPAGLMRRENMCSRPSNLATVPWPATIA